MDDHPIREVVQPVEGEPNLFLIPGSKTLGRAEAWIATQVAREQIVQKRLKPLNSDFVILDTSPAFSFLNVGCAVYASEVWMPVVMDYLVLVGLEQFRETLNLVDKELGHDIPIRYIIPTFYDERPIKTRVFRDKLVEVFGEEVFTNPIHTSVRVGEAASYHQPVFDYDPKNRVSEDFILLIDRIASDSGWRREDGKIQRTE